MSAFGVRGSAVATVMAAAAFAAGAGYVVGGAALASPAAAAAPAARAARPPRCASTGPRRIPRNSWPAAARRLAPAGAVAMRLCRYDGLNATPPLALTHSTLVSSRGLRRKLVGELDALRSLPGVYSCPNDDVSQILVLLQYAGGRRVTISVGLSGCNAVTNGDVNRLALNSGGNNPVAPRLLAELENLTGGRGG